MEDLSYLREIPLEDILSLSGAIRDHHDNKRWKTPVGWISIEGQKFFNWNLGIGGGGAIDLAKQLCHDDFKIARNWLTSNFSLKKPTTVTPYIIVPKQKNIPTKNKTNLACIRNYLVVRRNLPEKLIEKLINLGRIYADDRKNAVFLLLGKEKIAVGAELCGTGRLLWKGLHKYSKRHKGFFYTGNPNSPNCILCESGIDAISCEAIHPGQLYISTSGVLAKPRYLEILLKRNKKVYCGFDNDEAGDKSAEIMISTYPSVSRLRPTKKDWNAQLIESIGLS